MRSRTFNKFESFICYPDLCYKFLCSSYYNLIPANNFRINLNYKFSQLNVYKYIAIKAIIMLLLIYPKRSLLFSNLIKLKYAKARCNSFILLQLPANQGFDLLSHYWKHPSPINVTLTGHLKETQHFLFPGLVKFLKLPKWKANVTLNFNQISNKNLYLLLFYKACYLD